MGEDTAADQPILGANVRALLNDLVADAPGRRPPALTLAHDWHVRLYRGVSSVPAAHYLGAPRGSGHPDLDGYEVVLASRNAGVLAEGVPPTDVAAHLQRFEQALIAVAQQLDTDIPVGPAPRDVPQLRAVVTLAAVLHGEWVRIHPYANGNGRVARVWSNWVAVRYGLPPFVRIKPRPDGLLYGRVALASMGRPPDFVGDHGPTVSLFVDLLRQAP